MQIAVAIAPLHFEIALPITEYTFIVSISIASDIGNYFRLISIYVSNGVFMGILSVLQYFRVSCAIQF